MFQDVAVPGIEILRRRKRDPSPRRQIQASAKSRRKLNPVGAEGTFCIWAKRPECARAARQDFGPRPLWRGCLTIGCFAFFFVRGIGTHGAVPTLPD